MPFKVEQLEGKVHVADLDNPYRVNRKANLVCALEWAPVGSRIEPAMYLLAHPKVTGSGYIVPISAIQRYVTEHGAPLPALTECARRVALRLGLDTTIHTINLVCDVIMANVPDLLAMPKAPPARQ